MVGRIRGWVCLLLAGPAMADPVGLRGDIGGLWFDPQADGQGLQIDVLDGGRAAVTWYTYDESGAPLWLFGLGQVRGQQVEVDLSGASGGRFLTEAIQPAPAFQPRGRLQVQFVDCDRALLEFESAGMGLASGQRELVRLTQPQGVRCNAEEEFAEQRSLAFEHGPGGFTPLFADLPAQGQDIYELDFAWETLPPPLEARRGLRLTGHNRSDDLAMMIVGPVGGLEAGVRYAVELEVELASDVPGGCFGSGGSPGDGVYVKLGVLGRRPGAVTVDEGGVPTLRPDFDFGQQSQSGADAVVVGTLANRQDCEAEGEWELKTLSTRGRPLEATADEAGRLWVVAGTDSAFEGLTRYYFTALRIRLRPLS